MADETVSVRISLHDAITAGLVTVEAQARRTGDALEDMEPDGLRRDLDKTTQSVNVQEKGLRRLRLKALDVGFAFKALKIPAIAVAIVQATAAVSSLTAGLGAFIAQLSPAVGLVGALPGGLAALVSSMAVTKMALFGVSDAVKVLNKEGATVEEVNEALKGLSPTTAKFARQVAGLNPHMKALRKEMADAMLPFLGNALRRVVPLFDDMKKGLAPLATTIGQLAERGAAMVASGPWRADFQTVMGRNNTLVKTLGGALLSLLDVLRNVIVAAGPMVQRLADTFAGWADRLRDVTQRGRDLGTLTAFFDRAYETAARLGRTLKNFAMGLFNIFRLGRGLGDDMADSLEGVSETFLGWTKSDKGRKGIMKWFEDARPVLSEIGALVKAIGQAFVGFDAKGRKAGSGIIDTIRAIRTQLLPAVTQLIGGVGGELGPAIVSIATAFAKFVAFASTGPMITVIKLFGDLANLILDLGKTSPVISQAATAWVGYAFAINLVGFNKKRRQMLGMESHLGRLARLLTGGAGWTGFRVRVLEAGSAIMTAGRAVKLYMTQSLWPLIKVTAIQTANLLRQAAAWVIANARVLIFNGTILALRIGLGLAAAAQWALNIAMDANPVMLVVLAIAALAAGVYLAYQRFDWFRGAVNAVWQALQVAWDWVLRLARGAFDLGLRFSNLPRILGFVRDAFGWVIDRVRSLVDWFRRALDMAGRLIDRVRNLPGMGVVRGVTAAIGGLFGDTSRPRGAGTGAGGRHLGHTLRAHSAVGAASPGKQYVTNVLHGTYAGSDHRAGRALDLVGSGLQTYAANVRAAGGYAAMHGSAADRHLHAVYGDTARPRAARTASGGGGGTMVLEGPLIGTVYAEKGVDVERAVSQALGRWVRDRNERR